MFPSSTVLSNPFRAAITAGALAERETCARDRHVVDYHLRRLAGLAEPRRGAASAYAVMGVCAQRAVDATDVASCRALRYGAEVLAADPLDPSRAIGAYHEAMVAMADFVTGELDLLALSALTPELVRAVDAALDPLSPRRARRIARDLRELAACFEDGQPARAKTLMAAHARFLLWSPPSDLAQVFAAGQPVGRGRIREVTFDV